MTIDSSNALHIATQSLHKAVKAFNKTAQQAVNDPLNARMAIQLELAKDNIKAQQQFVKTAVEAAEHIIDLYA